jgi:Aldo/keto reductase family
MGMSEWYGHADWDESVATIHRALELGVTFLDTADIYGAGHNEVLVGRGIAGHRDEVQLATKFGVDRTGGDNARVIRGERGYVRRPCESSLLRLGVDVIDLYYLHRPPQTVEIEETVAAMAELVAEGKVRYLGLSEVDNALLRRAHAVHPITAVQSEYLTRPTGTGRRLQPAGGPLARLKPGCYVERTAGQCGRRCRQRWALGRALNQRGSAGGGGSRSRLRRRITKTMTTRTTTARMASPARPAMFSTVW